VATKKLSAITPAIVPPAPADQFVGVQGGNDVLFSLSQFSRVLITSNTTFFVGAAGNDSNDGLTSGTAWLTLSHALNYISNNLDVQIQPTSTAKITLNIGAGTFLGGEFYQIFNNFNGAELVVNGAGMGVTIINDGIQFEGGLANNSEILVSNLTLQGTANPVNALFDASGVNNALQNCELALTTGKTGVSVNKTASVVSLISCKVSGSGSSFIFTSDDVFATIFLFNITYSTPTFSDAVFDIGDAGRLHDYGTNIGSATGVRFSIKGIYQLGYGGSSIQAGVGTIAGVIVQAGQVQSQDGVWHGYVARLVLDGDTTYYISTTGSDSNNGLTPATAFADFDHCYNTVVCGEIDFHANQVTIQFEDGTYPPMVMAGSWVGGGRLIIQGNTITPDNVVFDGALIGPGDTGSGVSFEIGPVTIGASGISFTGTIYAQGFMLTNTTNRGSDGSSMAVSAVAAVGLAVLPHGVLGAPVNFGSTPFAHTAIWQPGGVITLGFDYSIEGDAFAHHFLGAAGTMLQTGGVNCTLVGLRNFNTFTYVTDSALYEHAFNVTFIGAATGKRFHVDIGGVIDSGLNGFNYFPGNAPGDMQGGIYS
jgi:hypothetical protein